MDDSSAAGKSLDLRLVEITKAFGDFVAVDNLSLTIPEGSFFALLGPSGCGKTTALRMIAGLEEPTQGSVFIGDEEITWRRPYQRPVNTVFQSYALFPHLDIFENVAFGPRRTKTPNVKEKVNEMLDLVQLSGLARRKPGQLSGGQQQRVAVARALINRPSVLLLDEPLGALDLKLRRQMQLELKRIQTEVGITFVHVTHDQEEAMTMADTIAVMNHGQVEQMGAPTELYENPMTTFVANFLGRSNLIDGVVTGRSGDDALVEAHGVRFALPAARVHSDGDAVHIGFRPEKITIGASGGQGAAGNSVDGIVVDASFIGVSTDYLVRLPWGQEVAVFAQNNGTDRIFAPGTAVSLSWEAAHTFALDASQAIDAGVEVDELAAAAEPAATS